MWGQGGRGKGGKGAHCDTDASMRLTTNSRLYNMHAFFCCLANYLLTQLTAFANPAPLPPAGRVDQPLVPAAGGVDQPCLPEPVQRSS